jgi:membrane protein implicated in regulation of membrane protease activity
VHHEYATARGVEVERQKMVTDIVATALAYTATVLSFVAWILVAKPARIPRTRRTMLAVALRTAPLYLLLFFACQHLGVSVLVGMLVVSVSLLCLLGPFGGTLDLGVFGFLYTLQQWILGWPDRELLFNRATLASAKARNAQPQDIVGRVAVVTSPLRPTGKVVLDGTEFDAASDLDFVDTDTHVEIVGVGSFALLVTPVKATEEQAHAPDP